MREIKFRGISKLTNEWVYGHYYNMNTYKNDNELRHIIVYENEGPGNQNEHEPIIGDTVGQYTGLKDGNGIEIYEGDIIEFYSLTENDFVRGEVIYHFGIFRIGDYMLVNHFRSCKVIGNIYENKDLLEL